MTKTLTTTLMLASLLLLGCSGSPADVEAAQKAEAALTTAVDAHRTRAAGVTTAADCEAEHQRYRGEAVPLVEQLRSLSGAFDGCMRQMSRPGEADFARHCGSMHDELELHAASACTGAVDAMHAETTRHCDAMNQWATLVRGRTDSVRTRMGGGHACAR